MIDEILNQLCEIADELDRAGRHQQADILTAAMKQVARRLVIAQAGPPGFASQPGQNYSGYTANQQPNAYTAWQQAASPGQYPNTQTGANQNGMNQSGQQLQSSYPRFHSALGTASQYFIQAVSNLQETIAQIGSQPGGKQYLGDPNIQSHLQMLATAFSAPTEYRHVS